MPRNRRNIQMYKIKENIVMRKSLAIGDIKDGKIDFYSGCKKYKASAMKALKKQLEDYKEVPKIAPKEEPKEETVYDILSDICGEEIPQPRPGNGWRGTRYRAILLKNYDEIRKSTKISNEYKKAIINAFM